MHFVAHKVTQLGLFEIRMSITVFLSIITIYIKSVPLYEKQIFLAVISSSCTSLRHSFAIFRTYDAGNEQCRIAFILHETALRGELGL